MAIRNMTCEPISFRLWLLDGQSIVYYAEVFDYRNPFCYDHSGEQEKGKRDIKEKPRTVSRGLRRQAER